MSSRIASSSSALLVSLVVVLTLQPVTAALTLSDLCQEGAAESALCQLHALHTATAAPPTIVFDVGNQMRQQRSLRRSEEGIKTDESDQPAPLRLAFWRFTRLHPHPRDERSSSAAASSISKNGGKRGYDFIRFGRSPSSSNKTPLASYDFIRLGRK